ncbi:partner of Y14 and mago [Tetranychus urticae]|uniref:Partner of Y14 and mago n=1 Tax=Tetranychus urticae TaxID=32264 RepID=T1KI79_TETUR|nr:partner of Y14 and mago [Tetranychus urticae]
MATMYVKDDVGSTIIPSSQRPDGSWRKPRRVKEGFVPQEEVPLYESKGKQFAKERENTLPPGLDPESWEKMKANQEKMARKKNQDVVKPNNQGKASNNANSNKGNNVKNKDAGSKNNGKPTKGKNVSSNTTGKSNNAVEQTNETNVSTTLYTAPLIIPGITGDDSEWETVISKRKKKAMSKEEASKAGGAPGGKESTNVPVNAIKLSNSVRIVETEKGIKVTNEAGQPLTTDPLRKLRNLKKKLKDIEKLKTMDPKKLEKEQKEKIKNENEVKAMIHQLESSLHL